MRFTDTLELRLLLDATLVKDLDETGAGSFPSVALVHGDTIYFTAIHPETNRRQFWKTDGTGAGTLLLQEFQRPPRTHDIRGAALGGIIYFNGYDPEHGIELWRTDGTPAGTYRITDARPGVNDFDPASLTPFDGALYFTADDGTHGRELWRTDGTAAGTQLVKDLTPGPASTRPHSLHVVGDSLLFIADTPDTGAEWWKTDGTAAGTQLVYDIVAGPADSVSATTLFAVVNGQLIFKPSASEHWDELWRTDGTAAGTSVLFDATRPSLPSCPDGFPVVGDTLYFGTSLGQNRPAIARTDGTPEGTCTLVELAIEPDRGIPGVNFPSIVSVDGNLFFVMTYHERGEPMSELWTLDGSGEPVRLKSVRGHVLEQLIDFNGTLLFNVAAYPWLGGSELWTSDGTSGGTRLVKAIGTSPRWTKGVAAVTDDFVFFPGDVAPFGYEPWRTDGTVEGTRVIRDVAPGTMDAYPHGFEDVGGAAYFATRRGVWKSDGTPGGTMQVVAVNEPDVMVPFDDRLYFTYEDSVHFRSLMRSNGVGEPPTFLASSDWGGGIGDFIPLADGVTLFQTAEHLWRTDGTRAGTFELATRPNYLPLPWTILGLDGTAYFSWLDPLRGAELWRTDGTLAGTKLVKDVAPRTADASPSGLFEIHGRIFFVASDGSEASLWTTDGTEEGTAAVVTLGSSGSTVQKIERLADAVVFTFWDRATERRQLWRSDGTPDGTYLLRDGLASSDLFASAGLAYFVQGAAGAWELWATDGSTDGTMRLATFTGTKAPSAFAAFGDRVVFAADDSATGNEPWVTDGTSTGTRRLADLVPGPGGSDPDHLTPYRGRLYFAAAHPTAGRELFVSDGTAAGTRLDTDVRPGPEGSVPHDLAVVNDVLFFGADDGVHGEELWRVTGGRGGAIVGTGGNDRYTIRVSPGGQAVEFANDVTGESYVVRVDELDAIHFDGAGGDDTLVIDTSNGSPLPDRGLFFHGGPGTNGLRFTGPAGARIQIDDGEVRLTSDLTDADLVVGGDAAVLIENDLHVDGLTVEVSARVTLAAGASLHARRLTIRGEGSVDLGDGTLIVHSDNPALDAHELTRHVRAGSLTTSHLEAHTGLGVFPRQPNDSAILVRSVPDGDANADGTVNADDYFRIDFGFLDRLANPLYGQGDFNYDGKINADDYFMIDSAFLEQAQPLASAGAVATQSAHTATTPTASAEPERKAARKRPARPLFSDRPVGVLDASRRAAVARRR